MEKGQPTERRKHHEPVMLEEILKLFEGRAVYLALDGTLGAGGHATAFFERHPEIKLLVGVDQDATALEIARQSLMPFGERFSLVHANFSQIEKIQSDTSPSGFDAILLDLGVSSMQLDQEARGFSFRTSSRLDMRMDVSAPFSAYDLVNEWEEDRLAKIFRDLGEEPCSKRVAAAIARARKESPIETGEELAAIVKASLPYKNSKVHPATRVFQAIRMAVNQELDHLEKGLKAALEALKPGGTLAVLTFHSLEDRAVKNLFKEAASPKRNDFGFIIEEPHFELCFKKPQIPTDQEIKRNPRSRSAKLRAITRL